MQLADVAEHALALKTRGSALFQAQDIVPAMRHYGRALQLLICLAQVKQQSLSDDLCSLRDTCRLNLAACHLKRARTHASDPAARSASLEMAVECCNKVQLKCLRDGGARDCSSLRAVTAC
eukprot:m.193267 g.193267  ORF g.193267 m.193267 type:complete len:121 (+) comp10604_c0_seq8:376-738(+)